jgi:hypothetical protein
MPLVATPAIFFQTNPTHIATATAHPAATPTAPSVTPACNAAAPPNTSPPALDAVLGYSGFPPRTSSTSSTTSAICRADFGNQMDGFLPQLFICPAALQLNQQVASATGCKSPAIEAQALFSPESAFIIPPELSTKSSSFATLKKCVQNYSNALNF